MAPAPSCNSTQAAPSASGLARLLAHQLTGQRVLRTRLQASEVHGVDDDSTLLNQPFAGNTGSGRDGWVVLRLRWGARVVRLFRLSWLRRLTRLLRLSRLRRLARLLGCVVSGCSDGSSSLGVAGTVDVVGSVELVSGAVVSSDGVSLSSVGVSSGFSGTSPVTVWVASLISAWSAISLT